MEDVSKDTPLSMSRLFNSMNYNLFLLDFDEKIILTFFTGAKVSIFKPKSTHL